MTKIQEKDRDYFAYLQSEGVLPALEERGYVVVSANDLRELLDYAQSMQSVSEGDYFIGTDPRIESLRAVLSPSEQSQRS